MFLRFGYKYCSSYDGNQSIQDQRLVIQGKIQPVHYIRRKSKINVYSTCFSHCDIVEVNIYGKKSIDGPQGRGSKRQYNLSRDLKKQIFLRKWSKIKNLCRTNNSIIKYMYEKKTTCV